MKGKYLILVLLIVALLSGVIGCKDNKAPEAINEVENIEKADDKLAREENTSQDESNAFPGEISEDLLGKIIIKDNRKIIEKTYPVFINEDATMLIREQYDLVGEYYLTFYRVDREGNILNVYDNLIQGIKDDKFNEDGFAIVKLKSESQEPGKAGVLETMNVIMDVEGNLVYGQVLSIESASGNSHKTCFYKVISKKYDDYGLVGYEGKVLNKNFETILEMPLYTEDHSPSSMWEKIYFTNEFVFYDNRIITLDGKTLDTNLDLTGNEYIKTGDDYICVEKGNEILVVDKNGLYKRIAVVPNIFYTDVMFKDLYKYYDKSKKMEILVCGDEEVYSTDGFLTLIAKTADKYILSNQIGNDRYKLITIENNSVKESDDVYYNIINLQNHYATREIRENGEAGFWTIYDLDGNEVPLDEGRIVDISNENYNIKARINNEDVIRRINYPVLRNENKLEIFDEEELKQTLLNKLFSVRGI